MCKTSGSNTQVSQGQETPHPDISMDQKLDAGCVKLLSTVAGSAVRLHGRRLVLQTATCTQDHGDTCLSRLGEQLAPRLWQETAATNSSSSTEFSFTRSATMLASTTELHTEFGWLKCLPDAEYALWRKAGLCDVTPLVIHLDGVAWRIVASMDAVVAMEDTAPVMTLADTDTEPAFRLYLEAHRDGGQLLEEIQTATSRGEQDLHAHREFLFKVFHIVSMPPTLSHDLSKTKLVNFALGRCFTSDDLKVLQGAATFAECMALVKRLHLEVENHHPEHGPRPALSLLDMYLDRVSRGVQKTHGWSNKAWCIPERFAPAAYKEDFAALEAQYGKLELADPGELQFPTLLSGACIDVRWEDVIQE